jgi:sigma-B regulation protein RsbU (phosphoserine phosphatase)
MESAVRLRPARGISGDIYDILEQPGGQTIIAFGDVSGKGAAAALYGSLISGLLRILGRRRRNPAGLMIALNEALAERKVEARYVSLLVMLWDPSTRQIVMANAGALPPMICRGGEILKVRVEGVPLGLLDSRQYEEVEFQAEPGDTVLLYSDGVTDHMNAAGHEFGRGRLAHAVRTGCGKSAAELIASIYRDLDKYNTTAFDDQTLFALQVK